MADKKFHVFIEYNDGDVIDEIVTEKFWFRILQPQLEADNDVINYQVYTIE